MKLKLCFGAILVTVLSGSCYDKVGDRVSRISVVNNSSETVSIGISLLYPDTSLKDELLTQLNVADKDHNIVHFDSKRDWAEVIRKESPGKKIMIFILPGAVNGSINPERWPDIRRNYRVLKRYELTAEELKSSSYTVTYP